MLEREAHKAAVKSEVVELHGQVADLLQQVKMLSEAVVSLTTMIKNGGRDSFSGRSMRSSSSDSRISQAWKRSTIGEYSRFDEFEFSFSEQSSKPRNQDIAEDGMDIIMDDGNNNKKITTAERDALSLQIIHELVSSGPTEVVTWTSKGDSFIIRDRDRFASELLTIYFKKCKYSSFLKELSNFGFRRVKRSSKVRLRASVVLFPENI
jgi:hypothetical protein